MSRYNLSSQKRKLLDRMLEKEGIAMAPGKQLTPRRADRDYPLSFAQSRLWFLNQLAPDNPFYNVSIAVELKMWLNIDKFAESLKEIVRRHESLRTTFAVEDGEPVQRIAADPELELVQIDLRHLAAAERRAEVNRLATEEAQKPFDLATGPLIRTVLLHQGDQAFVFLLTLHHIICDGWSLNLFTAELNALYPALVMGQSASLPDLPIQYADFAIWQRRWMQGENQAAQLAYWKAKLANLPILHLPTDRPRPTLATFRGAHLDVSFPASLSTGIRRLCQQEAVTPYMALLAVFKTLLHRYSGQTDIVLGSPILGRNRIEIEKLIGFFVNTLVMRTDLAGNPTFRELLQRVRQTATEAYANQELPFEKLVEEIQPQRDLSRNPLFQVMFQFFSPPGSAETASDAGASNMQINRGTSIFDLALHLSENTFGFFGQFEYSTDLFAPDTMVRMVGHFKMLLQGVVSDPDRRLADLPILTTEEENQVLTQWNQTTRGYPTDQCIHQIFEAQAARTPHAVALVFGDQEVTYGELDHRANLLAGHLHQLGVGPEHLVGISIERSVELLVALLAVLKTGAAYVPLDPAYPAQRIAFIMEDSSIRVLLTQQRLLKALRQRPATVVALDQDWDAIARTKTTFRGHPASPANPAYVIYTSGSTGLPKGTAMSHRALVNLIQWQLERSSFRTGQTVLQYTSHSFDVSFQEIFSTWCSGGKLVLTTEAQRRDPLALWEIIGQHDVKRAFMPYVALQQLADTRDGWLHRDVHLREVITAGEPLKITESIVDLFEYLPECSLDNQYGPTESHVVTAQLLSGPPREWPGLPPIGQPIANTRIYLLDAHLAPVPAGVSGEIFIAGNGLARGYVNRPGLTAERFLPDPFSGQPGARMYRTGDLARYLPDGTIAFLGRVDHQIKLRGFRIEPGEIECLLGRHPTVQDSVVVMHEDRRQNQQLVAYVVPRASAARQTSPSAQTLGGADPRADALRQLLQEKLPAHMIPAVFVFLEALPLTPSGKVDRKALPDPKTLHAEPAADYTPPRTHVEKTLARMWASVLDVEQVGLHDNFFVHLGGHSLLATKLMTLVRDTYQVNLPLSRIFEAPTIADFAVVIEEAIIDDIEDANEDEL